jgi:hypothetical protein
MTSQQRAEINLRAQEVLAEIMQDPNARVLLDKCTRVPWATDWMDGGA